MLKSVVLLCLIAVVIYCVETLSYSLSLIVWRSKQYSLTSSVFNVIALAARFAQMFQAPLLGVLVDTSIGLGTDPIGYFRYIILFATTGVLLAILILPSFLELFTLLVNRVSNKGSIVKGLIFGIDKNKLDYLRNYRKMPNRDMFQGVIAISKYKLLLIMYIVVSSIYSIGVLAAYYAAVSAPYNRLAVSGFSGSINGIASMIMILFFDPKIAMITDDVYKGKREYLDLKAIVLILILSRLLGTLIGQLLLIPASKWILFVFNILTN